MDTKIDINWPQIIRNLRTKLSVHKLSEECEISVEDLLRIQDSGIKEPRHSTGTYLLDLHLDYCPEQHQKITY